MNTNRAMAENGALKVGTAVLLPWVVASIVGCVYLDFLGFFGMYLIKLSS